MDSNHQHARIHIFNHHGHIHVIVSLLQANLEVLLRRIALLIASAILLHRLLSSALVLLKVLDLLRIHVLHHSVRLPLLEAETQTLVAVVLVVGLILVVLHLDEVRVHRVGVKAERDQCINGGRLGDDLQSEGFKSVQHLRHYIV